MYHSENNKLQMVQLARLNINSYNDGAVNIQITVPSMAKYKIFVLTFEEDGSFYSSCLLSREIFTDISSIHSLAMLFTYVNAKTPSDVRTVNFQLQYVNDTTVKLIYKNTYGKTWANIYANFCGIE